MPSRTLTSRPSLAQLEIEADELCHSHLFLMLGWRRTRGDSSVSDLSPVEAITSGRELFSQAQFPALAGVE